VSSAFNFALAPNCHAKKAAVATHFGSGDQSKNDTAIQQPQAVSQTSTQSTASIVFHIYFSCTLDTSPRLLKLAHLEPADEFKHPRIAHAVLLPSRVAIVFVCGATIRLITDVTRMFGVVFYARARPYGRTTAAA
jgi:hypothetical protein